MVGHVGVQTLNARSRATDTATGLGRRGVQRGRLAACLVLVVGSAKFLFVNERFETVNPTVALNARHGVVNFGIEEPEQRRHRGAVTEMGFVFNNDGLAGLATDDYRESTSRLSS